MTLIGVDCVDVHRLILAAEISSAELRYDDIRLLSSVPTDHAWVSAIRHIGDIEAYNEFVVKQLHRYVRTSLALVIQHDGFVLNPEAWTDDSGSGITSGHPGPWMGGASWVTEDSACEADDYSTVPLRPTSCDHPECPKIGSSA